MKRTTFDAFDWRVETTYELADGSHETEVEPFIAADGQVRNIDGSVYRPLAEAEPPREVIQRDLVVTPMVALAIQTPQGVQTIPVPQEEFRIPFGRLGAGLPAWERLAHSMRGTVPPPQVAVANPAMLGALPPQPGAAPPVGGHLGPNGLPRR